MLFYISQIFKDIDLCLCLKDDRPNCATQFSSDFVKQTLWRHHDIGYGQFLTFWRWGNKMAQLSIWFSRKMKYQIWFFPTKLTKVLNILNVFLIQMDKKHEENESTSYNLCKSRKPRRLDRDSKFLKKIIEIPHFEFWILNQPSRLSY